MASYIFDYMIRSNSNYGYMNVNNLYNFIYEIIEIQENEEDKERILKKMKIQVGLRFYNNYISYCNRKGIL